MNLIDWNAISIFGTYFLALCNDSVIASSPSSTDSLYRTFCFFCLIDVSVVLVQKLILEAFREKPLHIMKRIVGKLREDPE